MPGKFMLLIKEGLGDPTGKSSPQPVIGPEGEKKKKKNKTKIDFTYSLIYLSLVFAGSGHYH